MKWNVYVYNHNKQKIEPFNIFEHRSFNEYVNRHLSEYSDKLEFAEQLKSELRYYFWAKAEWEVAVAPWVGGDREQDAIKLDVYNQVVNNFEVFLDYVWNHKV